jgi:hypothetical protein
MKIKINAIILIALALALAIGTVASFGPFTGIANAYETSTDILRHIQQNDPGYDHSCHTQSC